MKTILRSVKLIVVDEIFQLQPVNGNPVFQNITEKSTSAQTGVHCVRYIFGETRMLMTSSTRRVTQNSP